MTYTVKISSRGTITIPKTIRQELGSSKILIFKQGGNYVFTTVSSILDLAGSFSTNKKLSDKDLKNLRQKVFIRSKNLL